MCLERSWYLDAGAGRGRRKGDWSSGSSVSRQHALEGTNYSRVFLFGLNSLAQSVVLCIGCLILGWLQLEDDRWLAVLRVEMWWWPNGGVEFVNSSIGRLWPHWPCRSHKFFAYILDSQAMSQTSVRPATRAQAETVIRWLKDEHINELGGTRGFYCNRSVIREAARRSRMSVLLLGRTIIGFAVFNSYGIDIFEIRPTHRRLGYGRSFAEHIIRELFARGSRELNVDCVPHESQYFWRSLGFVDQEEKYQSWGSVKLVLRNPSHASFGAVSSK